MSFKPLSLAQLFEPPEDHQGVFGWLCGYAADSGFLDDAVERFSGLSQAQRAHQGRVQFALMLDPGNPQILPTEAPGVLHLPVRSSPLPFALLHAKVAVLAFRRGEHYRLRLIVSTGNWTRQTLEESLDLAWHIDVANDSEDKAPEVMRQERTDLAAAWAFLVWLQDFFDTRALAPSATTPNESALAVQQVAAWATELGKPQRGFKPRFFDNRESSLIHQLPNLVNLHAGSIARNYLALGSGFFEGATEGTPKVPDRIFTHLRDKGLLTATATKNLFVNPFGCQAIASCQSQVEAQGWTLRAASVPSYFGNVPRTLHAKFVFSANERQGSNNCSSAWVYLGSGNLTLPGFMHKAGTAGNLEAGIVLLSSDLRWEEDRHIDAGNVVTNRLPIHWLDDDDFPLPALEAGADMPERGVAYVAPPVSFFLWLEAPSGPCLLPQGAPTGAFRVLGPAGDDCHAQPDGSYAWTGVRPRQVNVAWTLNGTAYTASVAVMDRYGRFCATELAALDLDEAWIQLANFPMPPDDEELADGDALALVDGVSAAENVAPAQASAYPVRRMMALVEDIAAKQSQIDKADWSTWCNRLEQVLIQAKDSTVVSAFGKIGLNPLAPLMTVAFRPAFAATAETPEGARYETALLRVVEAWNLNDRTALGAIA